MSFKNRTSAIITTVVILLCIVFGLSYAWLSDLEASQKNNGFKAGYIKADVVLDLDQFGIPGEKLEQNYFTIKNTSETPVAFRISLEIQSKPAEDALTLFENEDIELTQTNLTLIDGFYYGVLEPQEELMQHFSILFKGSDLVDGNDYQKAAFNVLPTVETCSKNADAVFHSFGVTYNELSNSFGRSGIR